jgi:hypothetical protein
VSRASDGRDCRRKAGGRMKARLGAKTCSMCRKTLPLVMFHNNRTEPDGLQHECINCYQKYSKKRRRKEEPLKKLKLDEYLMKKFRPGELPNIEKEW